MSQSGYTPILIYASGTTTNVPLAANLTSGSSGAELAINYADGKLFYKDSGGVVQTLATKGTGSIGGSNTQVQYNSSGSLAGSANLTFDGTTLTAAGLAGPHNGTVGATTPNTGAFTTLSASSTVTFNQSNASTSLAPTGTGTVTINPATAGTINNMAIGGTTAASGNFSALKNTALTSGRVVYSTTGGLETDSANLTFDGTTLTANALTTTSTVTVNGGTANGVAYLNGSKVLTTGSGFTYNSTGNLALAAPSSGTALTVNGVTGNNGTIVISAPTDNAQIRFTDSTVTAYVGIGSFATGSWNFGTSSAHSSSWYTNNSQRVLINSSGNVTINAPSSGAALSVTAVSAGTAISASANGGVAYSVGGSDAIRWASSSSASYIDYGSTLYFRDNSAFTNHLVLTAAGNVTINAPSSGNAFTLASLSATDAIRISCTTTATGGLALGFSAGLIANAWNMYTQNTDPLALGTNGSAAINFVTSSVQRMVIGSAGNVTINAPGSGTALTVTAATGGTTNAGLTVNGSAATPTSAVTFSATAMTVDCTKSNVFTTTFTANVTTAPTISNPQDGQTLNWFITQDATGSRTMTWPTSFKWPGGTAGVLSTAANAVDLLVATYRSSTGFWYATLSKGFA